MVTDVLSFCDAVRSFYVAHPVGGPLHIALDDGNLDDGSVVFCVREAIKKENEAALALALVLLTIHHSVREKMYEGGWNGGEAAGFWEKAFWLNLHAANREIAENFKQCRRWVK